MRTIKVELTIEVPSNYKIDEGMTDFAQVCDLLDEMGDRYSNVGLIDGRIIGGQNEGAVLETEDVHWKPSEEQMEVDLEKEIQIYDSYLEENGLTASLEAAARHFYELGLKARKEE